MTGCDPYSRNGHDGSKGSWHRHQSRMRGITINQSPIVVRAMVEWQKCGHLHRINKLTYSSCRNHKAPEVEGLVVGPSLAGLGRAMSIRAMAIREDPG